MGEGGSLLGYGLDPPAASLALIAPPATGIMAAAATNTTTTNTAVAEQEHRRIRLAAKPHAFAGAVLSPKHAKELTPSLALAIASALAEQSHRKSSVPYTLWITEAWRVLGWAEPSAALFWEMATMYHTLYLAAKAFASDYHDGAATIPPILSCGSTSSLGSGMTADRSASLDRKKQFSNVASAKELPVWLVGTFLLLHCEESAYQRNLSGHDDRRFFGGGSSDEGAAAPATGESRIDFSSLFKHSPLSPRYVGAYDTHIARVMRLQQQRQHLWCLNLRFTSLPPFLSLFFRRTRLHAGWNHDSSHCTAYLLRHLRKLLLLTAISHNPEAIRACMHLAAIPSPTPQPPPLPATLDRWNNHSTSSTGGGTVPHRRTSGGGGMTVTSYSADELRRNHDDEHGNVGMSVHLTVDDLERLHLVLQLPSGGGIDDPPLKIGEYLFRSLYQTLPPPTASLPIGDVERELRRHLELDLALAGVDHDKDDDDDSSSDGAGADDEASRAARALAKLRLTEPRRVGDGGDDDEAMAAAAAAAAERAKQPRHQYHKELSYTHLRGTTILLKPNPTESSSGASSASGEPNFVGGTVSPSGGRLHDLAISECSDAHFYLLQPFEHVTIAACTKCTIVVGAVAGLLHVVDCEKTSITSAGRRILVGNSSDVQVFAFTPSPPLLVGDNRSCQFAPYNTYYDGLREDLLATGLAAAVVPENQSPYHGGGGGGAGRGADNDAAWPPLQCASNKWKQPVELSKLEVPQIPASGPASSPPASGGGMGQSAGADDKAMGVAGGNDATMLSPVLMSASDFHILFVPLESDAARQRRLELDEADEAAAANGGGPAESQYCVLLAEILQLSPFRLPVEFERRALVKAERMRNIQLAVKKNLSEEQQHRFEEELNRGFREWLVQSGNLRQVLDLVHLERRGGT